MGARRPDPAALLAGDPAPDISLDAVGGGRVSLRDFRGRPVLLVFLRHLG